MDLAPPLFPGGDLCTHRGPWSGFAVTISVAARDPSFGQGKSVRFGLPAIAPSGRSHVICVLCACRNPRACSNPAILKKSWVLGLALPSDPGQRSPGLGFLPEGGDELALSWGMG